MTRLTLTAGLVVALCCVLLPGAEAGLKSWWDGMWGKGKGGGGKGKGRQHHRHIYLTAPPIYSHGYHQYKPLGLHHGYGGVGHDLHSFGGGYGGGHVISHSNSLGYGDIHGGIGGDIHSTIGSDIHGGFGGDIHGGIGGDIHTGIGGDIHSGIGGDIHGSIGGGHVLSSGSSHGGALGSYGHADDSFLQHSAVGSYSEVIESAPKEIQYTIPHANIKKPSHGSSYGSSYGTSYGKQHGFGPIKDDDLIVVQEGKEEVVKEVIEEVVQEPVVEFVPGPREEHIIEDSSEEKIVFEEPVTQGKDDTQKPTPVYKAGSNAIGDSYAGHTLNGAVASLVQSGVEPRAEGEHVLSAQLPMAEHGTSSSSYLDESPLPLQSESEAKGRSFEPSKQIPFPDKESQGLDIVADDHDTSHSSPQVLTQRLGAESNSKAVVTYDTPLNYNDPIIEIVFQDAEPTSYQQQSFDIDPSLYQQQVTDDVEVYFIEVSDDEKLESIDDLDLSHALAGVKQEFPEGLPSELTRKLRSSGYLNNANANIEVVDLDQALSDNTIDASLRAALQGTYGSSSNNVQIIAKPEVPSKRTPANDRLRKLLKNKFADTRNQEVARALKKYPNAVYGGIVELDDKESHKFLPVTVDGDRIPIPENLGVKKENIDTVLVYADENEENGAKVFLSAADQGSRRTPRHIAHKNKKLESWGENNWTPINN